MRRFIAFLVMLAFAAATAAPAITSCRMRAAQEECCCAPPLSDSICAPDCCETVKAAGRLTDIATEARGFVLTAQLVIIPFWHFDLSPHHMVPPTPRSVGLHERAAPRLPLRV